MTGAPSPWVRRFAHLVRPAASALDLACGSGRHAAFLAGLGAKVVAADRDPACGAALAGVDGVRFVACDLEGDVWPFAGQRFDAIVVTNYLHRPLFPRIAAALAPGGVLIYETFAVGHQRFGRPSRPQFLLRPGELLRGFMPVLRIVAYEDGVVGDPAAARVQRLCAVHDLAERDAAEGAPLAPLPPGPPRPPQ